MRLEERINTITPQDQTVRARAQQHLSRLTMPYWALGDLLEIALDLAGISRSLTPPLTNKKVVVMVGDHGVTQEGVSHFPSEVTGQMVYNFATGGAGINVLATSNQAEVVVVDMGATADFSELVANGQVIDHKIAPGTANMAQGAAMSPNQAQQAVMAGIQVADRLATTTDVFGTGDMGIGNTSAATAIIAAISGQPVATLTGRGTGIDDQKLSHKIAVIEQSLQVNQPDSMDGLDLLAKVGGFEIGGIAGLILGAAIHQKPVVIDGFISTAGALIAQLLSPVCTEYMICAHRSVEPGHRAMHERLGLTPLLDLNLRLGEGTGAALAMPLLDSAQAILTQMATFQDAGVSEQLD